MAESKSIRVLPPRAFWVVEAVLWLAIISSVIWLMYQYSEGRSELAHQYSRLQNLRNLVAMEPALDEANKNLIGARSQLDRFVVRASSESEVLSTLQLKLSQLAMKEGLHLNNISTTLDRQPEVLYATLSANVRLQQKQFQPFLNSIAQHDWAISLDSLRVSLAPPNDLNINLTLKVPALITSE